MKQEKPLYGGQAVVEGVMFAGKTHSVTAIRRTDGTIEYFSALRRANPTLAAFKKIPFVRGIVAIIEASATGAKHLQFASERYDVAPGEEQTEAESSSNLTLILGAAAIGVLSFLFAKTVFTLIPALLAAAFKPLIPGKTGQILLEGAFKLALLLGYIYFISLTPLVKRVFQYHGAEHKVINAYEAGWPLTVEHVQRASRLHYRCGSSFILFTVIVGLFLYLFVPTDPLWLRIVNRLALIPVVLGVSFEVLQFTNKWRDIPLLRWLGYPGLWLQRLTTKEPDDDQVEVAIASFQQLLRLEAEAEAKKAVQ
ncbi:Predicted metal-dependent enzyme [[Flavobacterium] thermophilum]|nr:Predicted metal-dependent enzyme [[Flavobacterium] thermophilum]